MKSTCKMWVVSRLDHGRPLGDYLLKPPARVAVLVEREFDLAGRTALVRAGHTHSDGPEWQLALNALTGLDLDLPAYSSFAVLVVRLSSATFALTWGNGRFHLDQDLVDHDFPRAFGARRLREHGFALVSRAALGVAGRQTDVAIPGGGPLLDFDLFRHGEVVRGLAGTASMTGLTYHRETGGDRRIKVGQGSLTIGMSAEPEDLVADLEFLRVVVDELPELPELAFLDEIKPISPRDPVARTLWAALDDAVGDTTAPDVLGLGWPVSDRHVLMGVGVLRVSGAGLNTLVAPDQLVSEVVRVARNAAPGARVRCLRAVHVVPCADEDGQVQGEVVRNAVQWLQFETVVDGRRYCLWQGRWYRFSAGYAERVDRQVERLLSNRVELRVPTWVRSSGSSDEHDYCELVAQQAGFLSFDRSFARTDLLPTFEVCDLLGPADELVLVKWLDSGPKMSHFLTQAAAVLHALRDEERPLAWLRERVAARDPERSEVNPRVVVLAIGGRQWDVRHLFPMSKVRLLELDQIARRSGLRLAFADLPHQMRRGEAA